MDIGKTLQELYAQKEMLERVIASLEELQRGASPLPESLDIVKRRGRKSMGAEERLKVAGRMKAYWTERRKPPAGPTEDQT